MNFGQLLQQVMVGGFSLFNVGIWAWTLVVLFGAAVMIFRSRGSERVFGIVLAIVVLMALPALIEDYPPTLAASSDRSWDKTQPYLTSLSNKMIHTIVGAWGSTVVTADTDQVEPTPFPIPPTMTPMFEDLPLRPPGPDGETGGDEETGGGILTAVPTAIMLATPTLAPTATPTPTASPTPTETPGWPPTPIIMTPTGQ
ncbi:MAG: hypothetical protein H6661_09975 [Ardenticatenaceae bacterium]|nr:hypothetical protein [Ardenticatenaceae bacterium]